MTKFPEELRALISLLDDTDAMVIDPVVDRLIEIGLPAIQMLEKSWETSFNPSMQSRIENVILEIQQGIIRKELKDWADCRGDELIYGAYLIAKSQYPHLEFAEIEKKTESLRSQIWLELNNQLTALEKVRVINHFLFNVHKFNRSIRGIQSPQLFYINHVLDTQKGLPISLAIIYAEIAARLDLPIYCVDLLYNFLLCYHDPTFLEDPDGILFYINPFTKGTVLGRKEVEFFLTEQNLEIKPEYMKPCTNIETISRLAEGLRFAYTASRMQDKADFMEELIDILKNRSVDQAL